MRLREYCKIDTQIFTSPAERCEHSASLLCSCLGCPGHVDDTLNENTPDDKIISCLDSIPDNSILVTHTDFIVRAVRLVCGTIVKAVPNFSVLRICGDKAQEAAVFYPGA